MKIASFFSYTIAVLFIGTCGTAIAETVQYIDPATGFPSQLSLELGIDSLVMTPTPDAVALAPAETPEELTGNDPSPFAPGEKIPLPEARPRASDGPSLKGTASVRRAKFTVYNPSVNDSMEGGGRNRNGERINSIEDAVKNGRPVTLAADAGGAFGKMCNKREHRCTILVVAPGFDANFPAYRKKFPYLPRNSFIGIVEDTGGAFWGSNGSHFDIAVRNRQLTFGSPLTIPSARWFVVQNPCGNSSRSRNCNLAEAHLEPTALAMIMD